MLRFRTLLLGLVVLVLMLLHRESIASMVHSWIIDTTYNHGFAIPLIAAFFVWQNREDALARPVETWWPGVLAAAALTGLWSVAMLVNVMVVAQLATVGLVAAATVTMLGPQRTAAYALPLTYLVFAVPFGQGIVPLLMEWTADFTVMALNLVGIPVIRDRLLFSIPSGNFEVAEACSGVRYLLASIAAGVAFAFLTYSSWRKRALFVVASIIVPIVANGFRAFGIVLIAHYSEMKYAIGIDHFIYGWFFFGIVIALLFLVGFRYADNPVSLAPGAIDGARIEEDLAAGERPREVMPALALVGVVAVGSLLVQELEHDMLLPEPAVPAATADIMGPLEPAVDWQLGYHGAQAGASAAYDLAQGRVEVRIATYARQSQGAELVNAMNRIAAGEGWQTIDSAVVQTPSSTIPEVRETCIEGPGREYLVWYWYQQGGVVTVNDYEAKGLELVAVLRPSPAAVVAIGTTGSDDAAQERLASFVRMAGQALVACAAGRRGGVACAEAPIAAQ